MTTFFGTVLRELKNSPLTAKIGLTVIAVYTFTVLFAPWIAPFSETEIAGPGYAPWGGMFLLGTDGLGRDMFSRMIYGARNTVGIAAVTTVMAFFMGVGMGLLAAVTGGWFDLLQSRLVDVMMAIPELVFALLILTVVGTGALQMILVIAVLESTRVYRVARAVAMDIMVMDYVEVARLRGERLHWVIVKEILPNAIAPLVAEFGIRFSFVFLFMAALSFLGLGLQPPAADWGSMVRENATLITFGDITPLLPAGAIVLLIVGVNFVVDWFLNKTSGLKE